MFPNINSIIITAFICLALGAGSTAWYWVKYVNQKSENAALIVKLTSAEAERDAVRNAMQEQNETIRHLQEQTTLNAKRNEQYDTRIAKITTEYQESQNELYRTMLQMQEMARQSPYEYGSINAARLNYLMCKLGRSVNDESGRAACASRREGSDTSQTTSSGTQN